LDLIAGRIDASVRNPQTAVDGRKYMLKDFAHAIVRGLPDEGPAAETEPLAAIFRYVRYGLETREDPADYDYYPSAGRTINSGAEDCDGKVIALNSLLSVCGYKTGCRVCGSGSGWHIYSIVGMEPAFNGQPSMVVPCDPRYGDEPGWEPADRYRKTEYQCTFVGGKVKDFKKIRNDQGGWFGMVG
jgi:hypothetical protein